MRALELDRDVRKLDDAAEEDLVSNGLTASLSFDGIAGMLSLEPGLEPGIDSKQCVVRE